MGSVKSACYHKDMNKFLPIGVALCAALILAALTFRFFTAGSLQTNKVAPVTVDQIPITESLPQEVPAVTPVDLSAQVSTLSDKVNKIDSTVNDLKSRVVVLESKPTSSAQTSSATSVTSSTTTTATKSPVYIPLAASGTSSAGDWANISGTTVTIDPADYPGYTSMQFQANIQIFQQGTAFARVGSSDGTAILGSEISTNSTSYTAVSSGNFTLPGKKSYLLQLKSLVTGYAASVQNAQIKVSF